MSKFAQRKKQILIEVVVKEILSLSYITRKQALAQAKKQVAIMLKASKEQEIANRRRALTDPGLDSITLNPTKGAVTLE